MAANFGVGFIRVARSIRPRRHIADSDVRVTPGKLAVRDGIAIKYNVMIHLGMHRDRATQSGQVNE
jgi:hypothetical protein